MRKLTFIMMVMVMVVMAFPAMAQDDELALPDFVDYTECEVDLTGGDVTIFHIGDLSGAYAAITLPLVAGLNDALDYFNARGGVCGATMSQSAFDTGGDPNRTAEGYEQVHAQDPDVIVLYSSADSELLRPTVADDEVPIIISAGSLPGLYGESGDEPGWVFATNPLYADQFAMFCDYIGANPDLYPDPVVGYMGWGGPVAAFGLAAFTPEAIAHCEEAGVEVLPQAQTFLPIADSTSVSTLVETHINDGATIIYVNALASGPVRVAEAIELIGFSEELVLGSVNWGLDTSAMLLSIDSLRASDGRPVVDGMIGSMPFAWYSDDLPGIELLLQQAAENGRGIETINISYILGWTLVDTYLEMYTIAANTVAAEQGLEDGAAILNAINGQVIKDTILAMDHDPLGLYNFSYPGGEIRALPNNRIVQMVLESAEITGPPLLVPLTEFAPAPDTRLRLFDDE